MAISTTSVMKEQLMKNPQDVTPEAGMEGNVTRTSMIQDLAEVMHDVDFRQLMEHYAAISGQSVSTSRPLTQNLMQEQKGNFKLGGDVMPGIPRTPVVDPNKMPNLQNKYSNMPVLTQNPNPTGIDNVNALMTKYSI